MTLFTQSFQRPTEDLSLRAKVLQTTAISSARIKAVMMRSLSNSTAAELFSGLRISEAAVKIFSAQSLRQPTADLPHRDTVHQTTTILPA